MLSPVVARRLEQALDGLQYGSIHLVIHASQIVRIERLERMQLTDSSEAFSTIDGRPTTTAEARHDLHKEA